MVHHHVCQAQQEMGGFVGYYYVNHNGFFLKVIFLTVVVNHIAGVFVISQFLLWICCGKVSGRLPQ